MTSVFKCDRCDAVFECLPYGEKFKDPRERTHDPKHLCEQCHESLKTWWEQ